MNDQLRNGRSMRRRMRTELKSNERLTKSDERRSPTESTSRFGLSARTSGGSAAQSLDGNRGRYRPGGLSSASETRSRRLATAYHRIKTLRSLVYKP